jgi:hypothetical protein
MLAKLESAIEASVVSWWRTLGLLPSRKMNGMSFNAWPDRLFPIPDGRPFFIEFKRAGGALTPLQTELHKQLHKNGYDVEVHDNAKEAIEAIKRRLDRAKT